MPVKHYLAYSGPQIWSLSWLWEQVQDTLTPLTCQCLTSDLPPVLGLLRCHSLGCLGSPIREHLSSGKQITTYGPSQTKERWKSINEWVNAAPFCSLWDCFSYHKTVAYKNDLFNNAPLCSLSKILCFLFCHSVLFSGCILSNKLPSYRPLCQLLLWWELGT